LLSEAEYDDKDILNKLEMSVTALFLIDREVLKLLLYLCTKQKIIKCQVKSEKIRNYIIMSLQSYRNKNRDNKSIFFV